MIKKYQLRYGDILVTNGGVAPKYYIFCNTRLGPYFISRDGRMPLESYDNNLKCYDSPEWNFIECFRPPKEIAYTYQITSRAYRDHLHIPIEQMIAKSERLTDDLFINMELYLYDFGMAHYISDQNYTVTATTLT